MLFTRDWISSALLVGSVFSHFHYKIDFVWPSLLFLCDFVCLYALFVCTNFVSFFLVPGPPEGCKCSQTQIGSFKIKVSQF